MKFNKRLQTKVMNVLNTFEVDPYNKILRRHKLKGKLLGFESIDVTSDIRIIIHPITYEVIEIFDVGTHAALYD